MNVDDKLPPIASTMISTSPSTTPVTLSRAYSNSRASTNNFFLPAINGNRVEFSRTSCVRKSKLSRQSTSSTPHFCSSTTSAGLVPGTPRQTSSDTEKYILTAAAKTRTIMQKFVTQLKTYSTYNPTFVGGGVYSTQQTERCFTVSAPWDTVGRTLDASNAYSVRHNFEEHFSASLERIPSIKEHIVLSLGNVTSQTNESDSAANFFPPVFNDKHSVSFDLWHHEHPAPSADEVRRGLRFWDMERAKHERLGRQAMRRQQESELDELTEYFTESAPDPSKSPVSREQKPIGKPVQLTEEQLKQQALWDVFLFGERALKRNTAAVRAVAATVGRSTVAAKIINDYSRGDELHEWVEYEWRNNTDRHETAALRIQCAYRCHLAKVAAALKRYKRKLQFLESLREEEKSKNSWNTALRVVTDELHNVNSNFDSTWRSVNFVFSKLYATAVRRRAEKKAEEERMHAVQEYAALTIQRVYRGHCGRQEAKAVRYPGLLLSRRQRRRQAAAIILQAAWRGHRDRVLLHKQLKAVLVIQRLVRSASARCKLRELRAAKYEEDEYSTKQFAARTIMRVLRKCVLRRHEYMMERWSQVQTLRRVARGYLTRLALQQRKHQLFVLSKALKIALWGQRHFRGARGRAIAELEREKRDILLHERRCIDAAIVIQRSWCAALKGTDKGMNNKNKNTTPVSNALNHASEPVAEDVAESACITIQRWYRSVKILKKAMNKRNAERNLLLVQEAAERILRFYRDCKSRERSLEILQKSEVAVNELKTM
ncbi:IQ motif [Trypanosoma melophagium]|uniref:IQ motif n=1 Tax=Trypanosoma melophagium TaxID=715481 RepID=UPI003519E4C2|nr:IQ motif [Trypanosoma melophagium]